MYSNANLSIQQNILKSDLSSAMVYPLKSASSERFTSPVMHQNGIPNENKHMNPFTSVLVFRKTHFKIQKEDYSYMIKHTLFGM